MSRVSIAGFTALSLLLPMTVMAQGSSSSPFGNSVTVGAPNSGKSALERRRPEAAPPALPGSRAEPAAVAPAERQAADMPPTEALFDAINRGDLNAAKDAVARGADLNGTNVLGLSPLELSVDLGRNSISFMLLSYRGAAGYSTSRGPAPTEAPHPPTRAERRAAEREARAAQRQQTAERVAPASAGPRAPRLFAGDGGAPVPQAGFLGFDSAR